MSLCCQESIPQYQNIKKVLTLLDSSCKIILKGGKLLEGIYK